MENQTSFELRLNLKSFQIPSQFDRLTKVASKIYNCLVFNPSHQYYVESNVSENVFKSFLNYWIKEEIPNINISNFFEYHNLSQEFNLLTDIIEKKKGEYGDDLQFFNGLLEQDNENRSDYEKQISENLDNYLDNYGPEIMKLPIQSLFNIFNHPERKLTKHNLAYNLIKIEFIRSNDQNIFVLLPSLDSTKISQENLEDSLCSCHLRNGMMPKIESYCFANQFEKQLQMEKEIAELQSLLKDQQSKLEQFITSMTSFMSLQNKKFDDLNAHMKEQEDKNSSEFDEIKEQINEQENKRDSQIDAINKNIKEKEDQITKEIDEIKKQIKEQEDKNCSQIDDIKVQIIEQEDKRVDQIINIREQINDQGEEIISRISKINEQISDQAGDIEEIKSSNEKNTNEINDLKKQLREQEEQNTNEINKINNLISNEIEGIKEKYLKQEKFDKEIKKIKELISNQESEIESIEESFSDDFEDLRNEIKWQKDAIFQYEEKQETSIIEFKKSCSDSMKKTENKVDILGRKINLLLLAIKKGTKKTSKDQINQNIKPGVNVPMINISSIPSTSTNDSEFSSPRTSMQNKQSNSKQSTNSPLINAQNREAPKYSQKMDTKSISINNSGNKLGPKSTNNREDDNDLLSNYNEFYSPRILQTKSQPFSRSAKNTRTVDSPTNINQNNETESRPQKSNLSNMSQSSDADAKEEPKLLNESKSEEKERNDLFSNYNEFYSPRLSKEKLNSSMKPSMRPTKSLFNDDQKRDAPNNSPNHSTSKSQMNDSDSSNKNREKPRKIKSSPFDSSDDDEDTLSSLFGKMKQIHLHPPSYYLNNKKKENSSSGPNSLRNSNSDSSESSDSFFKTSSDSDDLYEKIFSNDNKNDK
ncbi:hypothetical protein M9Y10_031410 [Tritrichomonas musculus]|uniref:Uncharacterized protein n=1 Tax=Tritrichomonas musculus TaxID=1915356 RepID=A0ABR2H1K6_9EUKA